jgi:hypothetical protein
MYFLFLFGGVGYFIGVIFDNHDYSQHQKTFHLTSIPHTHEIFHPAELPESVIIYSSLDNVTTVFLDFQVERKPENYRLSVLKNLQDYDFRVIEDSSKTTFSLCITISEFNYPSILNSNNRVEKFLYDIKERGIDFQSAIQKIIPGIVLSKVINPDIFGNRSRVSLDSQNPPNLSHFEKPPKNKILSLNDDLIPVATSEITESIILDDLKVRSDVSKYSFSEESVDSEDNTANQNVSNRETEVKDVSTSQFLTEKDIAEMAEEGIITHEVNVGINETPSNQEPYFDESNSIPPDTLGKETEAEIDSKMRMMQEEQQKGLEIADQNKKENSKILTEQES